MASLASLVSLGSVGSSSSANFEGYLSLKYRVPFSRNARDLRGYLVPRRWRVCRLSLTTGYIAEPGTLVSLDSTYKGNKENDADVVLKAAPKPVLRSGPSKPEPPSLTRNSGKLAPWETSKPSVDSDGAKLNGEKKEENKNNVIESLGEVLEKAEKLEINKRVVPPPISRPPPTSYTDQRRGKFVNPSVGQKPKPGKSVWRKGNPVSSVPTVVKESPKIEKVQKQESPIEEGGAVKAQAVSPLRPPQAPARIQPKLQSRPSVAPPPVVVKKPTILKDVGAGPILKDVGAGPRTSTPKEVDSVAKPKERKPILVDKFASKKPVVDPSIAAAVLDRPKPAKNAPPGRFRDDFRKKSGPTGGARRRQPKDDDIPDDETGELGLSISGASRKGRKWSKASRKAARLQAAKDAAPVKAEILEVDEEGMLVEELAYNLATSEGEILGYLYSKGIKPDGVQKINRDMVKMICKEYEVEVMDGAHVGVEEMARKTEILDEEDLENLVDRPPVLTIMGHVDHGKTTLMDYIRKSKVAASEAGGITQGIGAYKVLVPMDGNLQPCVFLDTPGHEAFGAMRARGARVTDIAIIVVAADDGIRPQTNEAIAHAKAAGVPIVIAINKIDKDGANPDRVMQELSSIGLMPEDWGGDVPVVQISALKGENVDDLLETVMLVAELQELKANPKRSAKGTVIEAGLDKSKGPTATLIVQNGTLKRGDVVVCGEAFGKVRALFDENGNRVNEAGPSTPVQVIGLNNVPIAGDGFDVVGSLDVAREKAETRALSLRDERISAKAGDGMVTLSSLASAVSANRDSGLDLHQLNIILKVDLQGSIDAVRQALQVLPQDNVTLKFLLQAPGDVSASDVDLAVATKAIILGFNVKVPGSVRSYSENKGVEIRLYRVIYDLIDDVRKAMEGLLDPVEDQVKIGSAEVRAVFSSGSGRVAGCMVNEGKIVKDCGIRVLRNQKTVYVGTLSSLKRVKEVVKEVNAGLECGIGMDDFNDWEEGDMIEAFNSVQKKRTLEEASATMTAAFEGAGFER